MQNQLIDPSVMEDMSIVTQVQNGNKDAFSLLVAKYERLVMSITFRFMRNDQGAEDAAQEAFMKAYLHLDSYNPEYRFSTWISRIAQNICIDMYRKRKDCVSLDEALYKVDDSAGPEHTVILREQKLEIQNEINHLDEIYREPLMMYHRKQMKYEEISDVLNIPMSMVKNRIFRARRTLRERIDSIASL